MRLPVERRPRSRPLHLVPAPIFVRRRELRLTVLSLLGVGVYVGVLVLLVAELLRAVW